jgi:hypothetical protein
MKLGAFSISLAVKDLKVSKEFYEKLGFAVFGGELGQNYLIMKNGSTIVGLFQGMFDRNILTFNPGWNQEAELLPEYTDVRDLHKAMQKRGIVTGQESLDGEKGPGSFVIIDPDGNSILIDQHI